MSAELVEVERELDAYIRRHLWELELRIRRDCLVTGPENDEALDKPASPDAPWQRTTVEEIMLEERARLDSWKLEQLAYIRRELGLALPEDRGAHAAR